MNQAAKKTLALIPARSGSKGLPNKNIKLLHDRPLIAWTIEAAIASGVFSKVIVSTDSEEIADISVKYGAQAPFIRPDSLASDSAKGMDVVIHAMGWMEQHGHVFDSIALLQPTSPLRNAEDIVNVVKMCAEKKANAIVSVVECEHHPFWSNLLPSDLSMSNFIDCRAKNTNRQDLPRFYRLNGAIYMAKWEYLKATPNWFSDKTYAYIMPRERSVDIDDMIDFRLAEIIRTFL